MVEFVRELFRKSVFSEDENIRRISILDALFGFVAGLLVGAQLFLAVLR